MLRNNANETLQCSQIITTENATENENVPRTLDDKNLPDRLGTNRETSPNAATSSQINRKRNRRFEDALLKWQEYGNDIIERKPPNFLELNKKQRKGTWIYAGGKDRESSDNDVNREANNKLFQKQVKDLTGRLSDNLREFQEMHERSAKIERTLKELKGKAKACLENSQSQ